MRTQIKKQLAVVIDRAKWLRGTGDGTLLRQRSKTPDENGCMCCLGFAARAAGMTKKEITNRGAISDYKRKPRALRGLLGPNGVEDQLTSTNDTKSLTGPVRERLIRRLGKKADILFSFVGRTRRQAR